MTGAHRHNGDWDLLGQLGLVRGGFRRDWTDLGTVRSKDWQIQVAVAALPAQFWRFTIKRSTGEEFIIQTGSGSFSGYWRVATRVADTPPDPRDLRGDANDGMVVLTAAGTEYTWSTVAQALAALEHAA